jgi:hypothetical protein
MSDTRTVVDEQGTWEEVTFPNGVVSRSLVEPSQEYLDQRAADRRAEEEQRHLEAAERTARLQPLRDARDMEELKNALVELLDR